MADTAYERYRGYCKSRDIPPLPSSNLKWLEECARMERAAESQPTGEEGSSEHQPRQPLS